MALSYFFNTSISSHRLFCFDSTLTHSLTKELHLFDSIFFNSLQLSLSLLILLSQGFYFALILVFLLFPLLFDTREFLLLKFKLIFQLLIRGLHYVCLLLHFLQRVDIVFQIMCAMPLLQ